jgi:hypothetical protein
MLKGVFVASLCRKGFLVVCVDGLLTPLSSLLLPCRTAHSPPTSTPSPWPPAPASTTTSAPSRGRMALPPPSPSRIPTSRPSTARATKCLRGKGERFQPGHSLRRIFNLGATCQSILAKGPGVFNSSGWRFFRFLIEQKTFL